jgi:hypothetical protein
MYHAKRISFLLSVLNCDDQQVRTMARDSLQLHMEKRKVAVVEEEGGFAGFEVDEHHQLRRNSRVNWARSTFVELNTLCSRLNLHLEFDQRSEIFVVLVPAAEDCVVRLRFSDPQQLYTAITNMEVQKDLDHWKSLEQQGRLQQETLPYADMSCSVGHLTNINVHDQLTKFIAKGRLQLLETNAVCNTYFPGTYLRQCSLCGFYSDTNSHALNGCRQLKGLYTERHDRCVHLVKKELEKTVITELCQLFENQPVRFEGFTTDTSSKPDMCLLDHRNSVAFIVEISNPFDSFIEQCFQHKFNKYMPLCFLLNDMGFMTRIVVLVVGSLGSVHRKVVPGLTLLGLSRRQSKALAKYLSISVMIGSRRAWARRGALINRL